jgi:hypothetical protein
MFSDRRSEHGRAPSKARREGHRYPVTISCKLTNSRLGDRNAEVFELSHQGCRIRLRGVLPIGHLVVITFPTLAPLTAHIIWSDGLSSGLSFTKPLGGPVLKMMSERHRRIGTIVV